MRHLVLTAAVLVLAGPALASSIEIVGSTPAKSASIVSLGCAHCPPLKPAEDRYAYKVPSIAPGTQAAEIVEIDGEAKLRRTEAWLGGSPVVFVSKAEGWTTDGSVIAADTVRSADGIDVNAKTAAVPTVAAGAAKLAGAVQTMPLDLTSFELRLH